MFLFIALTVGLGYLMGEITGYGIFFSLIVFAISLISAAGSYFYSDQVVLSTSKAIPVQKEDNPDLYRIVENLTIAGGIPLPKIYMINDESPNAFATGRDPKHASIAVTSGLQKLLTKTELEGVIAHELSHIKNYDIRLMAVSAVLVGFIALAADIFMRSLLWGGIKNESSDKRSGGLFLLLGLIFALLAPLSASLIQLAVSRKREFLADASGALLTRYPKGLADALEKISASKIPLQSATSATAHLFIANPFKGRGIQGWFSGLVATHPPAEERIKVLRSM